MSWAKLSWSAERPRSWRNDWSLFDRMRDAIVPRPIFRPNLDPGRDSPAFFPARGPRRPPILPGLWSLAAVPAGAKRRRRTTVRDGTGDREIVTIVGGRARGGTDHEDHGRRTAPQEVSALRGGRAAPEPRRRARPPQGGAGLGADRRRPAHPPPLARQGLRHRPGLLPARGEDRRGGGPPPRPAPGRVPQRHHRALDACRRRAD